MEERYPAGWEPAPSRLAADILVLGAAPPRAHGSRRPFRFVPTVRRVLGEPFPAPLSAEFCKCSGSVYKEWLFTLWCDASIGVR